MTFRSPRVAAGVIMVFVALAILRRGEHLPIELVGGFLAAATAVVLLTRFGLLSGIAAVFVNLTLQSIPLTLDPSRWYFWRSTFGLVVILALASYAFYHALAGSRVFKPLLDDL